MSPINVPEPARQPARTSDGVATGWDVGRLRLNQQSVSAQEIVIGVNVSRLPDSAG